LGFKGNQVYSEKRVRVAIFGMERSRSKYAIFREMDNFKGVVTTIIIGRGIISTICIPVVITGVVVA
jgi:uncharacterized Fe-S cluster-containing radical SAM superfamily protein